MAQFEQLPGFIGKRRDNHARYAAELEHVIGVRFLGVPNGTAPNYWFHSLLVEHAEFGMDRDALMMVLDRAGIETRPLWPPNGRQAPYRDARAHRTERADWFWERVLNLPCGSDLTFDEVDRVVAAISAAGT